MKTKTIGIREKIMMALTSLSIFYLMPLATASTVTAAGSSATLTGSLGLLISLGIENIPGVTSLQARVYYRWICFVLIMWIALTADKRSSTVFCVFAVCISAITAWWGWFTVPYPDGSLNPAGPWGLIILCALLTIASYMTESKRINFGISGAGDPLINIFTFFILLQGTIGLVNGAAIFPAGTGVATPAYCSGTEFAHCQINGATQLTNVKENTGTQGILNVMTDYLTNVANAAWNVILLIVQIAVSIAAVGLVIVITFPWISQSAPAMLLLGMFQVVIWLVYVLTLARWYGKTGYGEMRL
jgi:hypothetical protein